VTSARAERSEPAGRRWLRRALLVGAAFLLFNLGTSVVFAQFGRLAMKAYRIPSSAMEPTLQCARPASGCAGRKEDRILVLRFLPFWKPRRGEIIAFETPPEAVIRCGAGGTFVKRLVGLPGETVTEKDGAVFVDGRRLPEPYVQRERRDSRSGSWTVPDGKYFLMGDNRAQSCDSREMGAVARSALIGPVVARYWPLDRIGLL
jgi:signal peptidase I